MRQFRNAQRCRVGPGIALEREWATNSRWDGVKRPYTAADVQRLCGRVRIAPAQARKRSL